MEPTRHEVFTTADRDKRDGLFEQLRNSTLPNERQVVKFSGAEENADGTFFTTYSVAYPFEVTDKDLAKKIAPKHGSKRNPRQFPGRKKVA
jgi:hypothetical protein